MYSLGGFGWLDQFIQSQINNEIFRSLVFFGVLFIANDILSIPFELYDTFVIEQKFGFNKVTPRLFIFDKLKGYALTILIGGGLLYLVILIYSFSPTYFWLLTWSVFTVFSLFMSLFFSELIVPLFNKQTPLPEGELRTEIEKFASKVDFKLKNIFVIDGSKRSTKANAYFSGWGPKKRNVLYDTLMDKMTTEEIVAVLAHEIGHYKHRHTIKNMLISLPSSLLLFYLLGLILRSDELAQALVELQQIFI
jgi:STE24 endopeptidase